MFESALANQGASISKWLSNVFVRLFIVRRTVLVYVWINIVPVLTVPFQYLFYLKYSWYRNRYMFQYRVE